MSDIGNKNGANFLSPRPICIVSDVSNSLMSLQRCRSEDMVSLYRKELKKTSFRFDMRFAGMAYRVKIEGKDRSVGGSIAKLPRVSDTCTLWNDTPDIKDLAIKANFSVGGRKERLPILVPGSIPISYMIDNVPLPSGVVMVVAPGDAGKSPLSHAIASRSGDYSVIRTGEPMFAYNSSADDVVAELVTFLASDYVVCVLDSIKDVVAMGGSLMKQGVSRQALVEISNLSALCCSFGKTLIVPFNVSSSDKEMVDSAVEMARSNATGFITTSTKMDGQSQYSVWDGLFRTGEGMPRDSVNVFFSNKGELKIRKADSRNESDKSLDIAEGIETSLDMSNLPFNLTNLANNRSE